MTEDQLINLEILQGHLQTLGLEFMSSMCVDGQQAIDHCKLLIDAALGDKVFVESQVTPISLCLLDF